MVGTRYYLFMVKLHIGDSYEEVHTTMVHTTAVHTIACKDLEDIVIDIYLLQ